MSKLAIKFRSDSAGGWTTHNPTLAFGEIGVEFDSASGVAPKFKIGNGINAWSDSATKYFINDSDQAGLSEGGGGGGDPSATWYGSRGLHAGGMSSNAIDYFDITSAGNASDFGDLTVSRRAFGGVSDTTYGVFAGGLSTFTDTIDYVTIATTGNAQDFGDMTATTRGHMGVSNGNRGVFAGGYDGSSTNKIEYITLGGQTSGNGTDFGDLTVARSDTTGGMNDATRGVFPSTYGTGLNVMDYITIASAGNATDFGDHQGLSYQCATSDLTRGVIAGGSSAGAKDHIAYITIQTTGDAADFGDLTEKRWQLAATSDTTYGIFSGGRDLSNAATNTIDRISIATTGNATDHGDLNKGSNAPRFGCSTSGSPS